MKRELLCVLAITIATISYTKAEKVNATHKASTISTGIKFSEGSVAYENTLLISNFGTATLNPMNNEGLGYISKINGGVNEIFIEADGNLSAPKGMAISGDHLLIADVGKIVVYNMKDKAQTPQIINMPEGNLFVNDIVIKGEFAYISVTNTGKIFKLNIMNIANLSSTQLSEYASVVGANGLVISEKVMYIASYPADGNTIADNVIYIIEDIYNAQPKKLITRKGQYDGIALSGQKLYFSNWVNNEIGYVDLTTKTVKLITINSIKLTGPADISIIKNKLYIPNLPSSEIVVVEL